MSYKHISSSQRNELSALLRADLKQNKIAELLCKSPSAISQELKRNPATTKIGYDASIAKVNTKQRRIMANQRFRKIENNKWLRNYIIKKTKKYWAPEQIAGRLKRKWSDDKNRQIGKDSIYKFIYTERKDLVKYLRCQKGKYRRRYGTRIRIKQREELKKKRIDQRPVIVEKRERIGDWEGDTIIGKERTKQILTHVERKSGLLLADKLEHSTSKETKNKTIERFVKIPKNKKYTATYDNGTTFSEYEMTEKKTGIKIFFANAYHSWERGTNENANGLLRQFFPKKSAFAMITQEDIDEACGLINNRPRKRLNYLTPNEVFFGKNN
ncbi:MAG: IS30 family transposase [Candidatus Portnoybacteria bacterium CG10_big_fil_rev_8_21_14_0_10_36_7]|uniref:IS30 family transposase n=1 Tax=Candidatus Portnoybacteria bacterium CG10_big_fil_rev_8_21_14_0_10_36_7 TaxID=1974812 RepID=A0A2M8KDU8_9BACT|nr:MAG: IS30 family transposase [Candidatus Portnoybacteria bacterium CG10_big_fil_rev_8_21_14_0_10_36_7]